MRQQLGAVFKMHGVVVIPAPAPDEAVLFEHLDDLHRDLVAPRARFASWGRRPTPIVRMFGRDVDGDAIAVRGAAVRSGDGAADIGSGRRD